jgi:hypothetical protein
MDTLRLSVNSADVFLPIEALAADYDTIDVRSQGSCSVFFAVASALIVASVYAQILPRTWSGIVHTCVDVAEFVASLSTLTDRY